MPKTQSVKQIDFGKHGPAGSLAFKMPFFSLILSGLYLDPILCAQTFAGQELLAVTAQKFAKGLFFFYFQCLERVVKEADSGYPGGSCSQALAGVFLGDSAEGVDRDGGGSGAGFAQAVEARAGSDGVAGDGFLEDRSEENCGGVLGSGSIDFG